MNLVGVNGKLAPHGVRFLTPAVATFFGHGVSANQEPPGALNCDEEL